MPSIPVAKIEKFLSTSEVAPEAIYHAWLDVEGKRLLATDGCRAIRVAVTPLEGEVSGLVPAEVFELARKEMKAIRKVMKEDLPDPWLKVSCFADEVFIENLLSNTKHIVTRPKLGTADRPFPNVDGVFPAPEGQPTITLNRDLLGEICAALDGENSVSIWLSSDKSVAMMACATGTAAVVLMPMVVGTFDGREAAKRGLAAAKASA